jgi:hypothetical protein
MPDVQPTFIVVVLNGPLSDAPSSGVKIRRKGATV